MYIYGKNACTEAIKKGNVKKIYIYKNYKDREFLNKLADQNVYYKEKDELDDMVDGNHQGIVVETGDYEYAFLDDILGEEKIIMLDHLEDPHNFGAIIRTAEAAGIKSIIPKDRSVRVTGTVAKVSVGTVENVNIVVVNNLVNTLKILKKSGYWIIGTDMNGSDYKSLDYSGKIVLVIGNEGKGISRLVKENCDFIASIPMNGTVNSLNASVAAAIIMFEAVRK
ncbi:MAG: 23S rRNA (guanosine(2251)-2'-O)-methyltransferase RlmB [Bacilli bacterium]|nr:23S rRNA (guanosine(2251)-2'-O)-methyltransferase RlmB [Bacilli bacterium]